MVGIPLVYKIFVDLFYAFHPDLFRFDAEGFYGMSHVSITQSINNKSSFEESDGSCCHRWASCLFLPLMKGLNPSVYHRRLSHPFIMSGEGKCLYLALNKTKVCLLHLL